ncbi:MAG TPA: hypothetical protein VKZ59_11930, partial [Acidobacteriota bacterium]|nr:hypothetical protein [Acidobacteriota bacterium]
MMNRYFLLPAMLIVLIIEVGHTFPQPAVASTGPGRGVVALSTSGGALVSWRLLDSDPADVAFHVYRRDLYAGSGYERISETPIQ